MWSETRSINTVFGGLASWRCRCCVRCEQAAPGRASGHRAAKKVQSDPPIRRDTGLGAPLASIARMVHTGQRVNKDCAIEGLIELADTDISLDTDAAAATAAQWHAYADVVEQHGTTQHVSPEQLRALLGDTYADYIDAKQAEYAARESAYRRIAQQARDHAAKLDNTRRGFIDQDAHGAAQIHAVLED